MKIKKGFVLRVVGGEHVVVPVGEMSKNFSTYAIIGFSVLAAVLTGIVIGTTINKVRKERIW